MSAPDVSHRERVRGAVHLLDCAALYSEVFGLERTAVEYVDAATRLLEPAEVPIPYVLADASRS